MTARRKPKPRPGRPARSGKAALGSYELRLTAEERARWDAFAAEQERPLSQVVRESVETAIARGSTR